MTTEKRKRRLGSPPADWLTASDVVLRGSAETQRLPKIGGPPPGFGDSRTKERPSGPLTALVVSEDREAAARIAIALAGEQMSIRLALGLRDVESLLEGASVVLAYVPEANAPIARALRGWGDGRAVFALVPDRATADRVREHCDAAIEPPWNIAGIVASLAR